MRGGAPAADPDPDRWEYRANYRAYNTTPSTDKYVQDQESRRPCNPYLKSRKFIAVEGSKPSVKAALLHCLCLNKHE